MNVTDLQKKLIESARACPPSDRVPYAFEHRVIAHVRSLRQSVDPVQIWARSLMQAVLPCCALLLMVAVWSWTGNERPDAYEGVDELELAVVDSIDNPEEGW